MNLLDKLLSKFGYEKDLNWGKLFMTAKEMNIFGDKCTNPYAQLPNVFKAVKAIADNVPQAELIFKDWKTEQEIEPKELMDLFDGKGKPNPYMNKTDFIQWVVGFYALYGETFIIKTRSKGELAGTRKLPAELWTFNPESFQEQLSENKRTLIGWKVNGQFFTPEEVIHIKDFNPYNRWRGLAPTKPLSKIIDIDWASAIYNKAFFDNDATPGFGLSTDKTLGDEQRKRLAEWWKKKHKGASKAHTAAIFESGLKPTVLGSTHKDMDFIEQKKYCREEILGAWRSPKALFNITEDLNYATFMGQMKIFWLYTIAPILRKLEAGLNNSLIAPYNPNVYCVFDYKNVPAFQEDYKEKVSTASQLFAMGVSLKDINEKLELGFDEKNLLDVGLVPFNLVPTNQVIMPPDQYIEPVKIIKEQPIGLNRDIVWKMFLDKHTPMEIKFAHVLRTFIYDQRRRVLQALPVERKGIKNDPLTIPVISFRYDWDAEDKILVQKSTPYILGGIEEGIDLAKRLSGVTAAEAGILEQRVKAYFTTRVDKLKNINHTMRKQIEKQVAEGDSIDKIADGIREKYNQAYSRAKTIARTETAGTVNGGSVLYYEDVGINKKEWITAGDERVRPNHEAMQGQVVRTNERFSNGLDFPGGDGPAEEVINCRCTVLPIVEKEA